MNFKPMKDRLLVSEIKKEEKTKSGIFLLNKPENKDRSSGLGIVMAIGSGNASLEIKVGNTVIFGTYTKNEITLNDEKYLIVKLDDITAVM